MALARDRIVVVGGLTAASTVSPRADVYSIRENRWRRLPDLPLGLDHAAAAAAHGRVYVLGGYAGDRRPQRTTFVLERNRWRRGPQLPEPRAAAAAAVADGRLYLVGGVEERGSLARVALALDLATGRWSRVAGPTAREHLAAAALGGRVYAIGGRSAGIDTNTRLVEAYDPAARRWRPVPRLPAARGGTGAAVVRGEIVSVGGEAPSGTIAGVYAYHPRTRRWRRLPDLPTPRHGLGVVAHGGRVWTLAGGPQPGLTTSAAVESLRVR